MVLSRQQEIELRDKYFIPKEPLISSIDGVGTNISPAYTSIVASARYNFNSILSVLCLPYTLAMSSIANVHFQRTSIIERLRAINIEEIGIHEEDAQENSEECWQQFISSDENKEEIMDEVYKFLNIAESKSAAKKLLEQSVVTLWSIIEVLFRDVFELYLNENPTKLSKMLKSEDANKSLGDIRKLTLEELAQYDFDISSRIGTFLIGKTDFSKLENIKACVPPLFEPCPDLREQLGQDDLWLLNKRRHLFVHRAGIVDKEYIDKTPDKVAIGEPLSITPDMVEGHISTGVKLITTLVEFLPAAPC